MNSKINNIDDLRDRVLEAFEQLSNGDIDVQQAGVVAKLSETVISGLKTQMEYARMVQSEPHLPFLASCTVLVEGDNKKLLK